MGKHDVVCKFRGIANLDGLLLHLQLEKITPYIGELNLWQTRTGNGRISNVHCIFSKVLFCGCGKPGRATGASPTMRVAIGTVQCTEVANPDGQRAHLQHCKEWLSSTAKVLWQTRTGNGRISNSTNSWQNLRSALCGKPGRATGASPTVRFLV
jgi:hypothetical protein